MLKTPIGRLSLISLLEGISLLLLVFGAVPVKYLLNEPLGVRIIGPIHGGLFILYIFLCIPAILEYQWKFKTIAWLMVSSLIPFGYIITEKRIIKPVIRKLDEENSGSALQEQNKKVNTWLARIGITGFLFFLIKGLVWLAVFAGLIKGCS